MLNKKPFQNYTLEEDKDKKKRKDVVAVSLNESERKELEAWKKALDCPYDSTVLKILSRSGAKVILGLISTEDMKFIYSRERKRMGENLRGKASMHQID